MTRLGSTLRIAAASLTVGVATVGAPAVPTVAAPATCSGVWVVVGSTARCATSYSDGLTALRSAGFAVETSGGLVCRIDGAPATCTATFTGYWSYWHATRGADGTYGSWTYSAKGATQYRPAQGSAEGWSFGDGKNPPGRPPAAPAPAAPPPAPPTTSAPGPKATAPATKAGSTASAPAASAPAAGSEPSGPSEATTASEQAATVADSASPAPQASATPDPAPATGGGVSGPALAVFSLGALALGGVGVGFAARRRR